MTLLKNDLIEKWPYWKINDSPTPRKIFLIFKEIFLGKFSKNDIADRLKSIFKESKVLSRSWSGPYQTLPKSESFLGEMILKISKNPIILPPEPLSPTKSPDFWGFWDLNDERVWFSKNSSEFLETQPLSS